MSYSFQQICNGPENGDVNNSLITATFANPQTAGNLIIAIVMWQGPTGLFTSPISDSQHNVYHQALAPTFSGSSTLNNPEGGSMTIWYSYGIASATAGSNVVSAQFTGNVNIGDFSNNIVCWEVSYGSPITTDPFGQAGFTTGTSTGTINGHLLNVSNGGFVVCGAVGDNAITHGVNYTEEHQSAYAQDEYEDRYNLSGPTETPTVVVVSPWMTASASFNPPSGITKMLPTDAVFYGMT